MNRQTLKRRRRVSMIATVTLFDPGMRKALAPEHCAPVPLVPGEYELIYESHTVGNQFKRGRVLYCKDDLNKWLNSGRVTSTAQFDASNT